MAADEQCGVGPASSRGPLIRGVAALRADQLGAQMVRFAISGTVVLLVYIAVTTVLAEALSVRFEIALAVGWCTGVSVHFTLQRTFVWVREESFALPIGRQVPRYLLFSAVQFGVTTASTAVMPSVLGLPVEAVYLLTALMITGINFVVFRNGIFHAAVSDRPEMAWDQSHEP